MVAGLLRGDSKTQSERSSILGDAETTRDRASSPNFLPIFVKNPCHHFIIASFHMFTAGKVIIISLIQGPPTPSRIYSTGFVIISPARPSTSYLPHNPILESPARLRVPFGEQISSDLNFLSIQSGRATMIRSKMCSDSLEIMGSDALLHQTATLPHSQASRESRLDEMSNARFTDDANPSHKENNVARWREGSILQMRY